MAVETVTQAHDGPTAVSPFRKGHTEQSEAKRIRSYRRTVAERNRDPKQRFVKAFQRFATVLHACRAAGISSATFHSWRANDREFAEAVREAEAHVVERLEIEAIRRAEQKSDGLLWRLLQARKPETYASPRHVEVDARLSVMSVSPEAISKLTDDELAEARRIIAKLRGSPSAFFMTLWRPRNRSDGRSCDTRSG